MASRADTRSGARSHLAEGRAGRLRMVAVAVPLVVAVAGGLAATLDRRSLLVAGAVLLGWSQLVGP
jgi:hypothetical protein